MIIGIVGNIINLVVLTSKELQSSSRGHRLSRRSKSMFTYMKALAITDLLYLTMTIQGCVFIIKGYFRTTDAVPMPTQGMAKYIWNYMYPAWNAFMNCSDYIVVTMTLVRFMIIINVDQHGKMIPGGDSKPNWYIFVAICIPLLMQTPYFIQYEIIPCELDNESHVRLDCWTYKPR